MARTLSGIRHISNTYSVRCTGIPGDVNSSDDYIDIPLIFNPSLSSFTLLVWLKYVSYGSYAQTIYSQNNGSGTGRSWLTSSVDDGGSYTSLLGGIQKKSGRKPIIGVWERICVAWDVSAGTFQFYFNGNPSTSFSGQTSESADGLHRIGATKNDPVLLKGVRCMDAYVGQCDVYQRRLSNSEFITDYNYGKVDNTSLVMSLNFKEGSGLPQDDSGNGNHATALMNGAAWSSETPFPIRDQSLSAKSISTGRILS